MSLSISSNLKIYDEVGTHERSADLKYNMLKLHPSKWDKDNASNTIYHNSSHNYILDSILFFFKIKMISLLWPQNLWRTLILLWLRHRGHKIFCSQWWRKKSRASRKWNPRKNPHSLWSARQEDEKVRIHAHWRTFVMARLGPTQPPTPTVTTCD